MKKQTFIRIGLLSSILVIVGCGGQGDSTAGVESVAAGAAVAQTATPAADQYANYVNKYPDLLAAYNAYVAAGGTLSKSDWGLQHWTNAGQKEGRMLTGSVATSVASASGGSGGSVVSAPVTNSPFNASAVGCPDRSVGGAYPYCECQAGFVYNNPNNVCLRDNNYCPAGTAYVWDDKYDYVVQCFSYERMCSEYGEYCNYVSGGGSSSDSSTSSSSSSSSSTPSTGSTSGSTTDSGTSSGTSGGSSSSSVTYCTGFDINWPRVVNGEVVTISWSLTPSGCSLNSSNERGVTAEACNRFEGCNYGSGSVSGGSASVQIPCLAGQTLDPNHSASTHTLKVIGLGSAFGTSDPSWSGLPSGSTCW